MRGLISHTSLAAKLLEGLEPSCLPTFTPIIVYTIDTPRLVREQACVTGLASVRLSVCSGAADRKLRLSIDCCSMHAVQQTTAHSSKCGQWHFVSRRRKLDTDLFITIHICRLS